MGLLHEPNFRLNNHHALAASVPLCPKTQRKRPNFGWIPALMDHLDPQAPMLSAGNPFSWFLGKHIVLYNLICMYIYIYVYCMLAPNPPSTTPHKISPLPSRSNMIYTLQTHTFNQDQRSSTMYMSHAEKDGSKPGSRVDCQTLSGGGCKRGLSARECAASSWDIHRFNKDAFYKGIQSS